MLKNKSKYLMRLSLQCAQNGSKWLINLASISALAFSIFYKKVINHCTVAHTPQRALAILFTSLSEAKQSFCFRWRSRTIILCMHQKMKVIWKSGRNWYTFIYCCLGDQVCLHDLGCPVLGMDVSTDWPISLLFLVYMTLAAHCSVICSRYGCIYWLTYKFAILCLHDLGCPLYCHLF